MLATGASFAVAVSRSIDENENENEARLQRQGYRNAIADPRVVEAVQGGPVAKAHRGGEMLLERLRRAGASPEHAHVECLGTGACVPGVLPPAADPPEVVLRVSCRDPRRQVVERFTKEFAPLVTTGPPGVTGYTTGRPPVREVFAYWPALIAKSAVRGQVEWPG